MRLLFSPAAKIIDLYVAGVQRPGVAKVPGPPRGPAEAAGGGGAAGTDTPPAGPGSL